MHLDWTRAARRAAELCHLRQQCATLQGELQQARETIAALTAENVQLRATLDDERDGHAFFMAAFSDKCKEVQR